MIYKEDIEIDLTKEIKSKYIISSQHRKTGNPHKSLWTITFNDEVQCFIQTTKNEWINSNEAWGVKINNGTIEQIGTNINGIVLKLAKFVDGAKTNIWHGYPADYMNRPHDRPTTDILKKWVTSGIITKAKMSKIRQGIECNL